MIDDCKAGKVDMVLTKSISRFSRNVVDCLTHIRLLNNMKPPIEVYFEKKRLSSLDDKTDMILSLKASIAQKESRSISANISWAIRNRMKDGTQKIVTAQLLGYDTNEDGDGALLMHMGSMALLGANRPKNMIHVVINNGAHETAGLEPDQAKDTGLDLYIRDIRIHVTRHTSSERLNMVMQVSADAQ